MTRAVYAMGGAGSGKSTWMGQLLTMLGAKLGPEETLHSQYLYSPHHQRDYLVELRGHRWHRGAYLGVMRDSFPGADGLVRTSGPVARDWLLHGDLPDMVVGEGLLLSSRPFLQALHAATDLLVVHLAVPEPVRLARIRARGHEFNEQWSRQTVSRAANTARDLEKAGVRVELNSSPALAALWLEDL